MRISRGAAGCTVYLSRRDLLWGNLGDRRMRVSFSGETGEVVASDFIPPVTPAELKTWHWSVVEVMHRVAGRYAAARLPNWTALRRWLDA